MSGSPRYQLFLTPRSPFARRIRLALDRLRLPFEEIFVDVFQEANPALQLSPLGLVPVLKTPEGEVWFDSSVILEQLHDRTGAIWPAAPEQRQRVRQASALAAGLMQSAVLLYQEKAMHDPPSTLWLQEHREALERTLKSIDSSPEELWILKDGLTQAGWDLAVAEEYLAFRAPEIRRPDAHEGGRRKLRGIADQSKLFESSRPRLDD